MITTELSNGERLFTWPTSNHKINAGWTYTDNTVHHALDTASRDDNGNFIALPVVAAEGGTVDWFQKWDGVTKIGNQSYGNCIRIRHADYHGKSLQTLYAHLSKIEVQTGQTVTEGQIIGYTGSTGNVTGPHLHFEVRFAGIRVNPLNWLDDDFTCASDAVRRHLGSYTSVVRPKEVETVPENKLQMLCVVDASDYILNKAKELGLSVEKRTAYMIGPASDGDAMTIWNKAQRDGCPYFSSYTEV